VFYCLGRTVLHNNTPEKMIGFFDELNRILSPNGVGIIDVPKVPNDILGKILSQYDKEIFQYSTHLENLGVDPTRARHIFDGPDERHKFNRMALTGEQFKSYARLFGFEVSEAGSFPVQDGSFFTNTYYKVAKNPHFDVASMPDGDFRSAVSAIGILDPGIEFNKYVQSWELPLGVPIMFGTGPKLLELRTLYKQGKLGTLQSERRGSTITLSFVAPSLPMPE